MPRSYHRLRLQGCSDGSPDVQLPEFVLQQEAEYNMGRALQQVGLHHLAVECYDRVLAVDMPDRAAVEPWVRKLDLRREAAFNLVGIYKRSGSPDLATAVVAKYLTEGEGEWAWGEDE